MVNKKALEASGYRDNDKDPIGGWFVRNSANKISALQQNAQTPVLIALNESDIQSVINGLQSYVQEQLRAGVTSVQYMGTGFTRKLAASVFPKVNSPQRIRIIAFQRSTSEGRQTQDWGLAEIHPSPLVTISGVKYVIDGNKGDGNALKKISSISTRSAEWSPQLPNRHNEESF